MDLWEMDVRRFGSQYRSGSYTLAKVIENYESYYDIRYPGDDRNAGRPLKMSSVYSWHQHRKAVFGEKAGWERVNYYRSNENPAFESLRPRGWAGKNWSTAIVAEAMATGVPVVVTREGALPELVAEGTEGLCATPADPQDFGAKIGRLIDDPVTRATLSEAAKKRSAAFDSVACAERVLATYRALLTSSSARG